MKLAKLSDYERGLRARSYKDVPSLTSFEFSNLPGFADGKLSINATFAAVCGGTGVGKTAILELMFAALTGQTFDNILSKRLGDATASIDFNSPAGVISSSISLNQSANKLDSILYTEAYFVGLNERTSDAQRFIIETNLEVLKEGVDGYFMDITALSLIAIACRKSYKSIKVFEMEGVGDRIIPFFEVEVVGGNYDSRSMATGELSIIYLAWAMHFIPPQSIIFIEEPEAYLPPISHFPSYQLIATFSVIKKISFFISTHSPDIASKLSPSNLICIRTEGDKSVALATADAKMRVLGRLGLAHRKSAVVFVEDDLAKIILSEILSSNEFSLVASIEIVKTNGAGSAKKALEAILSNINSLIFLGVLDGDMEGAASKWSCQSSLIFLPFELAMETEFLQAIQERKSDFVKLIDRSEESFDDALAHYAGHEFHDRFTEIANFLGISKSDASLQSYKVWKSIPGNKLKVSKLVTIIANKLGVSLPTKISSE